MGLGRGHGQLIYYKCGGPRQDARDCTNSTRISCPYCEQFDHEMIDCPTLIAQIHEKRAAQPTTMQNVQMMRVEPCEEDPNINMVLRSGATTGEDKRKVTKDDAEVHKETDLEASKSFTEVSTPGSKDQPEPKRNPLMLTTFLETCMKLLRDNRAVKGLQELITRCVGSGEPRVV